MRFFAAIPMTLVALSELTGWSCLLFQALVRLCITGV